MTIKRLALVAYSVAVVIGSLLPAETRPKPAIAQLPTAGLHVEGVSLVTRTGERFVAAGVNMEMYRDRGCNYITNGQYPVRDVIAAKVKMMGINAIRLNYNNVWLSEGDNIVKYLDMAQALAAKGLYVMPSDHAFTGQSLANRLSSYPMMKAIVDGMAARGLTDYLIMNPWNEPGPDMTWSVWKTAQLDVLAYLRNSIGFKGVVVLDGRSWAADVDVATFISVRNYDASINGGAANVVFSNHWYPNIGLNAPTNAFNLANQVPLIVGELGQYNETPDTPQYVRDVISGALNNGIPKGHNGLFAWILGWCDSNKMIEDWTNPSVAYDNTLPLNAYGNLWVGNYYAKVNTAAIPTPIPPPATIIVQLPTSTPTRSIVPTNTPRPRTATPTRTVTDTPVSIITNTPAPTGVVGCLWAYTRDIQINGRAAQENVCVTYK